MPRHLILPKTAFEDVKSLLRLEEDQLRILGDLFGTSASIAPRSPDFIGRVAERLRLDIPATESIVLVCQFLLTVVEEGNPPEEILNDVREFVTQNADPQEQDVSAWLDRKRQALESLLTPKPERSRALKVQYLAQGPHPVGDSFRTVCELRPVFERLEDRETIVGYVPVILLAVQLSDTLGEERTIHFQLTPESLKALEEVLKRTKEKLAAIEAKFDNELLGE